MKSRILNTIMIISLSLIGLSFLLPNEFNETFRNHPDWFFTDFWNAFIICSLILLPTAITLSIYKLNTAAYWTILVYILIQAFEIGTRQLFHMHWTDYLIHGLGIAVVVLNFYIYSIYNKVRNKLLFGIGILYFSFLVFFSVIGNYYDGVQLLIIFSIIGSVIYFLIPKIDWKLLTVIQILYFLLLMYVMTNTLNCNLRLVGDIGYQDWSFDNLFSNCSSFYLWIISGIIIYCCITLKLGKRYSA